MTNPLFALAEKYYAATPQGGLNRKPDNFLDLYHSVLAGVRDRPLHVLELGVSSGASTLMWLEYLPFAHLVGLDLLAKPAALETLPTPARVDFIQGDQCDPQALQRACDATQGEGFDVIIDDASHIGEYTRRSFDFLFPAALKPGGLYVIEDFHTGYMATWADGYPLVEPPVDTTRAIPSVFASHQHGMVGWLKQLFDDLDTDLTAPWLKPSPHRPHYPMESFLVIPHLFLVRKRP
jgi:hypothetical protein